MLSITAERSRGSFFVPFSIFSDSLIPLLFTALAFHYPKKKCIALAASLSWLLTILLRVFAVVIYDSARLALDYDSLKMLLEHAGHQGIQAVLGRFYYLWIGIITLLIGVGLYLLHYRASFAESILKRGKQAVKTGIITAVIFTSFFLIAAACPVKLEVIYSGHLTRPLPVSCFYLISDTWQSFSHTAPEDEVYPLHQGEIKQLDDCGVLRKTEDSLKLSGRFDKLLIIALESLDLNFIIDSRMPSGTTPVLHDLLKRYPSFDNYFTAAQPTTRGLYAMLSSRLNPDLDLQRQKPLKTLFSLASAQGFETCYFSPLSGSFADNDVIYRRYFGMKRCFFLEEWQKKYGWKRENFWGVDDEKIYYAALQTLHELSNPKFVALISTIDTHPPYTCSGSFSEAAEKKYNEPFLRSLFCADHYLGVFLREFMKDKKLFDDRTLIIVTADHSATHGVNYLNRTDYTPDRIPLILISKREFLPDCINLHAPMSAIDFAPFAASLLGLPVPESFAGRIPVKGKRIAFSFNGGTVFAHFEKNVTVSCPVNHSAASSAAQVFYHRFYR